MYKEIMTACSSKFEDDQEDYDSVGDDTLLLAESTNDRKHTRPDQLNGEPPSKRQKRDTTDIKESSDGDTHSLAVLDMARNLLKETWGFPSFRLKQEAAIARLIAGGSAAVVFPTGGGKSLAYQIPALAFDQYDKYCGREPGRGVTLIVSPLIALMKDQVDALKRRRVNAAAMDSSQSRESYLDTCDKLRNGDLKLLYVAPERLNNEGFIEMINAVKVRMVAVDEGVKPYPSYFVNYYQFNGKKHFSNDPTAHCISEWGPSFRPDYLKVARFVKEVQAERVLCLTATATPKVAQDICAAFDIEEQGLFRTTTYRSNLRLLAQSFKSGNEKVVALKDLLRKNKGATIVYVQTHEQTETVCAGLKSAGFNAYGYHAGMATPQRTVVQEKFMKSNNMVIVATIAFGMGIDKSDIRNIVHYAVPKSLEGYSQEIGRAGRDGLDSICMTYLCGEDIGLMEDWSRADVPSLRSVKGLVGGLLDMLKTARAGDVIERNLNEESKEWDIKMNALGLLNAQLELRFKLIRAITPKYSEYKYIKSPAFESMTSDPSKISKAIKQCSKTAKKWTHIDVDTVARTSGLKREDAIRKLQEWHGNGAIELQPSGVVHRFRVLKDPMKGDWDKVAATISELIYAQIEEREKEDLGRIQSVVDLITAKTCISRRLAEHFGDAESVTEGGCGHCQFCETQTPIKFDGGKSRKGLIDMKKVKAVLDACSVRDDPRFLARVAFGMSSPRVTQEKLGKHPVFGSMEDADFEELVQTFTKICKLECL